MEKLYLFDRYKEKWEIYEVRKVTFQKKRKSIIIIVPNLGELNNLR